MRSPNRATLGPAEFRFISFVNLSELNIYNNNRCAAVSWIGAHTRAHRWHAVLLFILTVEAKVIMIIAQRKSFPLFKCYHCIARTTTANGITSMMCYVHIRDQTDVLYQPSEKARFFFLFASNFVTSKWTRKATIRLGILLYVATTAVAAMALPAARSCETRTKIMNKGHTTVS